MKERRFLFWCLLAGLGTLLSCTTITEYPESKKVSHVDVLHGIEIKDPYRWLEDFTGKEAEDWIDSQNAFSRRFISNNQYRKRIKENLESIWVSDSKSIPTIRKDRIFYFFNEGSWQQSKFMTQACEGCNPEVLIDPNTFSEDGTVSLSSVSVSPNGKFAAYSLSDGGSDWKTWKILEIESKKTLDDHLEWTKFSSASWEPDNSGFYYSKFPEPKKEALSEINKNPQLYFHRVGSSQKTDTLIYERPDQPNWSWSIQVSEDGLYQILSIGEGTEDSNRLYIKFKGGDAFLPIVDKLIATYSFLGSEDNNLWFYTNLNSPNGKIVKLIINNEASYEWKNVIEETKFSISEINLINNKFVVTYLLDTQSYVKFFNLDGAFISSLNLQGKGTLSGFNGKKKDRFTYFSFTNYITPKKIYRMDLNALSYEEYWSESLPGFKNEDFNTELRFYKSKDGTQIPLHLSYRKDTQIDDRVPVLLYGYGGFNISILPSFSKTYLAWMNQGGVIAVANLRGGAEYGDKWHESGRLMNKQNVFDDFAYAAKYLHASEIGSKESTVIQGRSNGGLLVGATMLQNPDLFAVTIPQVGVMDMLRFSKFTIGWAWESDYGSVDDKEEFLNLLSYSPYHNIKEGQCYPPTLITTANRDDRVVPSHSFKFTARLQEAQGCKNPILLRVETRAGHGSGTPRSKRIEEIADIYGYALSVIKDKVN